MHHTHHHRDQRPPQRHQNPEETRDTLSHPSPADRTYQSPRETCEMRETLAPTTQHTKAVRASGQCTSSHASAPKVQPTKAAMKCARLSDLSTSRRRQRPRGGAACGVWAVGGWCRGGAEGGAENDAAVAQQWCRAGAERGARSGAEGVHRVLVQTPTQCGL